MTSASKPPKVPRMGCPLGVGLMVLIAVEIAIYLSLSLKVQLSVGDATLQKLDEQYCSIMSLQCPFSSQSCTRFIGEVISALSVTFT